MKKYLLHPATFRLDGGAMFGVVPKPLWEKKITPDDKNRILMALRCILIETDNRLVLIDSGIGDYHPDKFNLNFDINSGKSPFETVLSELGFKTSDVTDVILTHLHFDHVGGLAKSDPNSKDSQCVFENATIHVHKKHFEYAQNPSAKDGGSFHPLTFMPVLNERKNCSKLNLIDGDEGLLLEDGVDCIEFKISMGHTPYMLHPVFDKMIYMADLVPMAHHIHLPWIMAYDVNPVDSAKYKEMFYDKIIREDLTIIFEHDDDVWGCKIQKDDNRYLIKESFTSNKELTMPI